MPPVRIEPYSGQSRRFHPGYHGGPQDPPRFTHRKYEHHTELEQNMLLHELWNLPRTLHGYHRGVQQLCDKFHVSRQYLSELQMKSTDASRDFQLADMPHPGRPSNWTEERLQMLEDILAEHKYNLSVRQLTSLLKKRGVDASVGSVEHQLTQPGWRITRHVTRPELTPAQEAAREAWALDHQDDTFNCHVDLDEKWFYGDSLMGFLHLPPGVHTPRIPVVSKRFTIKVLVVTAVAKPNPRYGFDGKVGMWPVVETYEARRDSLHHAKGDVYFKNASLDSAQFHELIRERVAPAIRRKMPWCTQVTLQMDNAPPHTGLGDLQREINSHPSRRPLQILLQRQPVHSPDANVNDLGLYFSLERYIDHANVDCYRIEDVIDLVKEAWENTECSTIANLFRDKRTVVQLIIKNQGRNDFMMFHHGRLQY